MEIDKKAKEFLEYNMGYIKKEDFYDVAWKLLEKNTELDINAVFEIVKKAGIIQLIDISKPVSNLFKINIDDTHKQLESLLNIKINNYLIDKLNNINYEFLYENKIDQRYTQPIQNLLKDIDNLKNNLNDNDKNKQTKDMLDEISCDFEKGFLSDDTIRNLQSDNFTGDNIDKIKNQISQLLVLGEFQHNDKDNGEELKIIFYVKNIKSFCNKNKLDIKEMYKSVFVHEYFHAIHFLMSNTAFDESITIESLASYFQYFYTKDKLQNNDIAKNLTNSWYEHTIYNFPYAGAKYLNDFLFASIFQTSLSSLDTTKQFFERCYQIKS